MHALLCQQTSPKRWFANVYMTSYCDATNSVYAVTMATIRHRSMREFGKGAYNQEVAPGITRPLHATDTYWFLESRSGRDRVYGDMSPPTFGQGDTQYRLSPNIL